MKATSAASKRGAGGGGGGGSGSGRAPPRPLPPNMVGGSLAERDLKLPDTAFMAIRKEEMQAYFGPERLQLMTTPADIAANPSLLTLDRYHEIPQDDPLWRIAREKPTPDGRPVLTASAIAGMIGMHDRASGIAQALPETMFPARGALNSHWAKIINRMRFENYPDTQNGPLMNVFCKWGNHHENNANSTFLEHHPNMVYKDKGLTIVTQEMMAKRGMKNLLTGKPFDPLPFYLGASPDGILEERDAAGNVTARYNGEWKAPTGFVPMDKKNFPGLDWMMVWNRNPYEEIKSYYIPQVMLQLLACENEIAFWGSWTLNKGMRVWKIRFDKEYMELVITLLLHVWECRADTLYLPVMNPTRAQCIGGQASVVPVKPISMCEGYFNEILQADHPARVLYQRLIDKTNKIVSHQTDIATIYTHYEDTSAITRKILGVPPGAYVEQKQYVFPDMPPEIADYFLVALAADQLYQPIFYYRPVWVFEPTEVDGRVNNLRSLMECTQLMFARPAVEEMLRAEWFAEPIRGDINVRMAACSAAEKFISYAAALVVRMHYAGRGPEGEDAMNYLISAEAAAVTGKLAQCIRKMSGHDESLIAKEYLKAMEDASINEVAWIEAVDMLVTRFSGSQRKNALSIEHRQVKFSAMMTAYVQYVRPFTRPAKKGGMSEYSESIECTRRCVIAAISTARACMLYVNGEY